MIRILFSILGLLATLQAFPLQLDLPTQNHHLFTGEFDKFYMYVDRHFEGQATKPWEAGSFGLVRNMVRVHGEAICTKFHEGIDIAPLQRDSAQNPLDLVNSIAAGRVVHTSLVAGRSNYGKYVVVEHRWEDSLIYSLYAHLADVSCQVGDLVQSGTALGKMGYTGAGIDRIRAHCHLELGLLMSTHYEDWHQKLGGGINHHGNFNGMNLSGTDVAHFLMAQKNNPELQLSQFIATIPTYFKVTFPSRGVPDFLKRYPWLSQSPLDDATSWEISFSATGQPLAFKATTRAVTSATITSIRPSKLPHSYLTRGLVTGVGDQATLTLSGKKLVAILTDEFSLLP